MKQNPSNLKFKKNHKIKNSFFTLEEKKSSFLIRGTFALKALEYGKLSFQQIEAGRKSIRRNINKKGQVFIRVFTYHSVTKRSKGIRMGKGKASHHLWMCPVFAGQIIYELCGVSRLFSLKALKRASYKLPFKTKIVKLLF